MFTLPSLNHLKSEWVTAFSTHLSHIYLLVTCIVLWSCLLTFIVLWSYPLYTFVILHVFLLCVRVCVFMYSRTIALLELMFLLIKPTLNKVYFTLLYLVVYCMQTVQLIKASWLMYASKSWVIVGSGNGVSSPLSHWGLIVNLFPRIKLKWNFVQNTCKHFHFKKYVSKSVVFLFGSRCVKRRFRKIITLVSYWGRMDLSYV